MLLLTAEPKLLVVVVLLAVCGDVGPVSAVGERPWPTPFLGCKTRARACVVHAQRTRRYVPCLSRGSWPPRGRPEEPAPKRATAPVGAAAAAANGDVALSV